ncbi:MAG: SRPBCC domain-containing protein [Gemmatimonadales bacterium]|nr:SRPBCC domain-containing protein [Gemmatimonadales bacterium]MBP6570867.1 SRPBCC domain-containing protein [Gemmatimonadales bacterium]MBP7619726.1 SRPBCC domain-containing protein [Gemmatimonadales bacterium]MBP9899634.1 SRPBCC domain-containing protein [Gemmatimonadales bacterium]
MTGTTTNTVRLVSKVVIRGRIEDVWREITKTDTPQLAFFGAQMRYRALTPGSPVQMRTPDAKYTSVVGEILEVSPPYRFSHTMKFTAHDDPYCKVTYELKEVPDGVEFTLISEDVPIGTKTAKDMTRGGDFIVKTLKEIIENGSPALGTRILFGVFGLLAFTTPAKCLSTHWPLEESRDG